MVTKLEIFHAYKNALLSVMLCIITHLVYLLAVVKEGSLASHHIHLLYTALSQSLSTTCPRYPPMGHICNRKDFLWGTEVPGLERSISWSIAGKMHFGHLDCCWNTQMHQDFVTEAPCGRGHCNCTHVYAQIAIALQLQNCRHVPPPIKNTKLWKWLGPLHRVQSGICLTRKPKQSQNFFPLLCKWFPAIFRHASHMATAHLQSPFTLT